MQEVLGVALPQSLRLAQPALRPARVDAIASLGPTLVCFEVLALGLIHGTHVRRARILLRWVAWSGAGYALYGVITTLVEPTLLLWRERTNYIGVVLGTFTNRNVAATYFGSCASIWLLLSAEHVVSVISRYRWSGIRTADAFSLLLRKVDQRSIGKSSIGFAICFIALAMTNSRAGIVCSLAAIGLAVLVMLRRSIANLRWKQKIALAAGFVTVAFFLASVASHRFDMQGFADEGRFDVYKATWVMILDHPILGVGLGAFKTTFPAYRSASTSIWGIWEIAHSTPLELAAEVGLPLGLFICVGYVAIWLILVRGAIVRRRDNVVPLIAATVAAIGGAHSVIDYSLQIPGYAIVCMAVVGTGMAQAFTTRQRTSAGPLPRREIPRFAGLALEPGDRDLHVTAVEDGRE